MAAKPRVEMILTIGHGHEARTTQFYIDLSCETREEAQIIIIIIIIIIIVFVVVDAILGTSSVEANIVRLRYELML